MQVSALCVGCLMFGYRASREESVSIIKAAIDAGVNFFDTANMYGGAPQKRGDPRRDVRATGRPRKARAGDEGLLADGLRGPQRPRHQPAEPSSSNARAASGGCGRTTSISTTCTALDPDIPVDEPLRALDDLIRAGRCATSGRARRRAGSSSSRCGSRRSWGSTASSPRPRRTASLTGVSRGS